MTLRCHRTGNQIRIGDIITLNSTGAAIHYKVEYLNGDVATIFSSRGELFQEIVLNTNHINLIKSNVPREAIHFFSTSRDVGKIFNLGNNQRIYINAVEQRPWILQVQKISASGTIWKKNKLECSK